MARSDLHCSHGLVSSYSSVSRRTSAAGGMQPPYASSADPHPPTTMTKPLYDGPPNPTDAQLYPTYPESYDLGIAGPGASGAASSHGGGGQTARGFSATSQIEGGYPHGWAYGLGDLELAFPPSPPGRNQGEEGFLPGGEEGNGLQHQSWWDCGSQLEAYPFMVGNTVAMANPMSQYALAGDSMGDTMPVADSMSQYVPVEDSMGGCYESLTWPPAPMGHISPSPSQSSYQVSSPGSGNGPQFSRHNSCSSLTAPRAAALEQTRLDARFRTVPDQAASPGESQFSPGGTVNNSGSHTAKNFFSSADQKMGSPRKNTQIKMKTATATTDYNAGTVSPAMTTSPKDSTSGAPFQPMSRSARGASDHRPRKTSVPPAATTGRTSQQKNAATTETAVGRGRGQGKKQTQPRNKLQPKPPPQSQSQSQPQQPPPPRRRAARNREAANKCRAKTKLAVADLESTERDRSSEHRELSATARGLRDEVLLLKNEVLAHGNCNDSLIQQYLTNQAHLVGAGPVHNQQQQQQLQLEHQHQQDQQNQYRQQQSARRT